MKSINLTDFLTETEILLAVGLFYHCKSGRDQRLFVDAVNQDIIMPNLDRINAKLGQENDPRYLSYACEYVISQIEKEP